MPFVCKKGDAGGRAHPFILGSEHGGHPDWNRLLTVRKVVLRIRDWDVGKGIGRAQNVSFPHSIKEVWEGQGSMRGSMLQEKGGSREGIICKATVLAPGNDVNTRRKSNTVGVGPKFSNSSRIIISYKGHFNRKTAVFTG